MENFKKNPLGISENFQKKPEFKYSPENPPPLDILRKRIFLVHATDFVPSQDILRARARDNSKDQKLGDQKPPSFRPTLHFSMGELFSAGLGFSRENMPYAVLLSLQKAEQQLLNVFPNDTVILGDIKLDEASRIILPEGTNYDGRAMVVRYNPEIENLRSVVRRTIDELCGWDIHTDTFIDGPRYFASPAVVENIDVGDQRFFRALLQEYPYLSFGSHFHSEKGEAWRTGIIDYKIADIISRYNNTFKDQISTRELSVWKNLIAHNLKVLETSLSQANYPDEVMEIYKKDKEELDSWLNVVDVDLYVRESYGKTIVSVKKEIWENLRDARKYPSKMKSLVDEYKNELYDSHNSRVNVVSIADALASMSRAEFESFTALNKTSFNVEEMDNLKIYYAIKRWLIVKTEKAKLEGIDSFLESSVQNDIEAVGRIIKELEIFLTYECNRLDDALEIVRMPFVQTALSKLWSVRIENILSLRDFLVICPETAMIFQCTEMKIDQKDEDAYSLLKELDECITEKSEYSVNYKSFMEAKLAAMNKRRGIERVNRLMKEIRTPINTARDLDEIGWGETMTYYEVLRRDNKNMETFFARLGLSERFREMFPTDQAFWNSHKSLLIICKELQN
jgi:hypothetical protein